MTLPQSLPVNSANVSVKPVDANDHVGLDLSIVIVNWNTREMTLDCIESVKAGLSASSARPCTYEIILVDNGSEDGSADAIAERVPDAVLLRNKQNRGFAAANNQGIAIAKGRYILLLNSDTLIHGNAIQNSVAYLESADDIGAVGIKALNEDGTTQYTCSPYPSVPYQLAMASGLAKLRSLRSLRHFMLLDWDRNSERQVDTISGCYLLTRRKVLDQAGLLDEAFFFFGEETDWCRRVRDRGWRLMFSPVGEFTHFGSVSARKLSYRRDVLLASAKVRLHRKHGGTTSAFVIWLIAAAFNISRAIYWGIRSVVGGGDAARQRAAHFSGVVRNLGKVWRGDAL